MESFFAAAKKLKYDGPNELIARAGDTLSTDFIERLRRMADADQNGASDGGERLLPTGDPLPAAGVRAEIAEHIARVKQQGFTVIENVIPPELVAAVREDVVEAVRTIKAEWDALGETSWKQHPPGAPPGISQLAHLPSLAPYFGDERMLGVARGLLDPHLRIAQCEAVGGTIRQPDDNRPLFRAWHSDWPHDLTAGPHSGSIAQPFPDVTMALSTVWYLNDASPESGGTWVVPHSHRDLRNPRGVLDAIDENAPIPRRSPDHRPCRLRLCSGYALLALHRGESRPNCADRSGGHLCALVAQPRVFARPDRIRRGQCRAGAAGLVRAIASFGTGAGAPPGRGRGRRNRRRQVVRERCLAAQEAAAEQRSRPRGSAELMGRDHLWWIPVPMLMRNNPGLGTRLRKKKALTLRVQTPTPAPQPLLRFSTRARPPPTRAARAPQ